jgi:hypothetical protein
MPEPKDVLAFTSRPNRASGLEIWQPYAGQEYAVFIDEPFKDHNDQRREAP